MSPFDVVSEYRRLLRRAMDVINTAREYEVYDLTDDDGCDDAKTASLSIVGDCATVTSWNRDSDYGLNKSEHELALADLLLSNADWKRERALRIEALERAKADRHAVQVAEAMRQQEKKERAALAFLKKKYEQ